MAKGKWSTPDFAGSGKFLVLPQDHPHPRDLRDIIQDQSDQGWDVVEVVGLNQEVLLSFAKRDSRDQSQWKYDMEGERGLESELQERTLNGNWKCAGWEIVTVWCDYQRNVPWYVCRRSAFQHLEHPHWENKVVERPVTEPPRDR